MPETRLMMRKVVKPGRTIENADLLQGKCRVIPHVSKINLPESCLSEPLIKGAPRRNRFGETERMNGTYHQGSSLASQMCESQLKLQATPKAICVRKMLQYLWSVQLRRLCSSTGKRKCSSVACSISLAARTFSGGFQASFSSSMTGRGMRSQVSASYRRYHAEVWWNCINCQG